MKKSLFVSITLAAIILSACNPGGSEWATASPTARHEQLPTEIASPTPTALPATSTPAELPPVPVVYYYFAETTGKPIPAGSVVIVPDQLILGPTLSEFARSSDSDTNIRTALQAMLNDPRNQWTSSDVSIMGITLDNGAAHVVLEGDYYGVGDVSLIAARWQIVLTVFAEAAVQTATITLNGDNVANLGVSHSSQAKPDDYAYTRIEVDAFLEENAYNQ